MQSVKTPMESHDFFMVNPQTETQTNNPLPNPPALDKECESMDSTNSNDGEQPILQNLDASQHCYPVMYPAYMTQILPFLVPFWLGGHSTEAAKIKETHKVLKPIAVRSKSPINVDKLVGNSKLSIGESLGDVAPFLGNLKT
ncbi:Transcription factor MYBS3 [Camellia lanceoleosa]|uniref:Transcription factor MYBS3 n=1 Tax=Camellia lanceoleosa TaxID=1840588 RepID=A0ACC0GKI3_9ERIC|nr:Transcription factor MYBS3 [Camellia lanceoleosa]